METVPTPSTPVSVSLLDLTFLTKEERMIISNVLKADEELHKVEEGNEGSQSVDLVPLSTPPNSLYGSELIRKSLKASSENETEEETVSVPSPVVKPQSSPQEKTQVKPEEKSVVSDTPSSTTTPHDGEATESMSNKDPKDSVDSKEEEIPRKETTLNKPVEKVEKKHTRKHSVENQDMNSSLVTREVQSKLRSEKGVSSENLAESADTISPLTTRAPSASITRRDSDLSRKRYSSMQPSGSTLASSRYAGISMSMHSLPSQTRSASSGKLKHAESISSIGSMTALSRPSRGDYDITGDVLLAIEYKKKELLIHVKKARGLASSNAGSASPDAYIKIYLLPEKSKHSKRKTDVKRKTANPVYKEILKYRLPKEELNARTIWLTVWDRDLFNTSKFIGEISLPVASLDLSNPAPKWYKLQDYAQPSLAPSAPTASSSQLAVRRGSTPLRIETQSAPRRRLMMEQTPTETRGMQVPRDPHHPTIIKDGPPTSTKGLQPASTKQQAVRKVTTIVKTTEYLPGFETVAEARFIITKSRAHTMEWKGYGIKLHIPEGALPPEHTECRVDIKAGLAGQFTLPDDSELISCAYWFSCPHKFLKPLTLEVQHCASLQDSSYSSSPQFVIAKCSQAELPYRFRTQMSGTFSPQSSFGSIQVSQLSDSIFGITIDRMFRRCYCGHLYYTKKESNKWNVDFVITWNLSAYLKAIQSTYSSLAAAPGPHFEVHFQSDSISLELPEDGLVLPNGWAIRPLGPLVITKQQVNEFTPGQRVPCCQLQVKPEKDKKPVELEHKVKLLGAKKDFNFFTITCTPEENLTDSDKTAGGDRKELGGSKQEDTTLPSTATPTEKGSVD